MCEFEVAVELLECSQVRSWSTCEVPTGSVSLTVRLMACLVMVLDFRYEAVELIVLLGVA